MAVIVGDDTDESLSGGADNDTIEGQGGHDTLVGNGGDDLLDGGSGNDRITDDANDTLIGAAGDDTLTAGRGQPFVYGGAGNDRLEMNGGFFGGSGTGGRAFGGGGDDVVLFTAPVGGHAQGGTGTDMLSITVSGNFGDLTGGQIDFSTGSGSFTGPGDLSLSFSGFERLFFQGNRGDDIVVGGALDDTAYLYDGDNRADMAAGNDTVATRYGGQLTLEGGTGEDVLIVMDAILPVYFIVDGLDGSVDDGQLSQISGFERYEVLGGALNDTISLGTGDDTASGLGGADTIFGAGGNDQVRGNAGSDSLTGGSGRDGLNGGGGNDVLHGDLGRDSLVLTGGADTGYGGKGNDWIVFRDGSPGAVTGHSGWGGAGLDVFVFRAVDDLADQLGDFTAGEDRLVFAAAELAGAPGAGEPVLLSQGAAVGSAAQFVFVQAGPEGQLFWDADGEGGTEAQLLLVTLNGAAIGAADIQFIL
jgi:Ca2+-binding RTX toxin-like protein